MTREERIAYDNGFACGFVLARGIAKKKQVGPLPIFDNPDDEIKWTLTIDDRWYYPVDDIIDELYVPRPEYEYRALVYTVGNFKHFYSHEPMTLRYEFFQTGEDYGLHSLYIASPAILDYYSTFPDPDFYPSTHYFDEENYDYFIFDVISEKLNTKEELLTLDTHHQYYTKDNNPYHNVIYCNHHLTVGPPMREETLEDLGYNIGDVIFYEGNIRRRDGKHLFRKPNDPQ